MGCKRLGGAGAPRSLSWDRDLPGGILLGAAERRPKAGEQLPHALESFLVGLMAVGWARDPTARGAGLWCHGTAKQECFCKSGPGFDC